jgi:hypothetical protein
LQGNLDFLAEQHNSGTQNRQRNRQKQAEKDIAKDQEPVARRSVPAIVGGNLRGGGFQPV